MSRAVSALDAADVAEVARAWRQLIGRRTARWDGVADDDLDLVDDRRIWQANRRRERHERKRERVDESVRGAKRAM